MTSAIAHERARVIAVKKLREITIFNENKSNILKSLKCIISTILRATAILLYLKLSSFQAEFPAFVGF